MTPCPGGDHPGVFGELCCDPCWERLPARLPDPHTGAVRAWRRSIVQARMRKDWRYIERMHGTILAWLREHPA
jgi:hypothetical protein